MTTRLLAALLTLTPLSAAADWPQFRGPAGNGLALGEAVPATWDEDSNLAWRIDVPGDGWSAPIVVAGKVLLTTTVPADGDDLTFEVHCYDLASGARLWKRVAKTGPPSEPTHRDNTYASETPVTDGERVYAYFGMNGLFCYDLSGEPVWSKDLGVYPMNNDWGASSSPVLVDGKLVLQIDNREASFVVALDAATGDEAWRAERPDEQSNWSTPTVWRNSQRTEVVLGGKTVRSYDPATGDELWNLPIGGRSSATATAVGDTLYLGSENRVSRGGTPGGLFAVRAGAAGTIDPGDADSAKANGLVWMNVRGAVGISSPLVYEGQIYVPERRGGVIRVHDAATGEESYRKRLPGAAVIWASPFGVNGAVHILDERGQTHVLAPGAEYEVLRQNELPGRFWSTPAVSDGSLVLRSQTELFCVRATNGG
ncbi:outer membrane biogenesis protein BamB [Planctomycetes bacterium MalM25]|nr:outer membrane biogenesis protein BamB [Planctomycetes bacterium MalM25]